MLASDTVGKVGAPWNHNRGHGVAVWRGWRRQKACPQENDLRYEKEVISRGPGRGNSVSRAPVSWREARGGPAPSEMAIPGGGLQEAWQSLARPTEAVLWGPRLAWPLCLQVPLPSPGEPWPCLTADAGNCPLASPVSSKASGKMRQSCVGPCRPHSVL